MSIKRKLTLRTIFTSTRLRDSLIAILGGVALAFAFPKVGAAWLAPIGAGALFFVALQGSWKRGVMLAWLCAMPFFAISFSWFATTVGAFVGVFAPAVVLVPAFAESLAFIATALLIRLARRYAPAVLLPLCAAIAFTLAEWSRSVGILGVPFAQLGYSQAQTPLAVFAAYIGTYGITFVLVALGAYAVDALLTRTPRRLLILLGATLVAWIGAWYFWPARALAAPTIPVAAIQGNIAQSFKWTPNALSLAIRRYTRLTLASALEQPRLVVWPETVVTTQLNRDPALLLQLGTLARTLHTTLVLGSLDETPTGIYNALYIFDAHGVLENVYWKRQLVPFAESFPGKAWLSWIPYAGTLIGGFSHGRIAGVYASNALPFAPLICWESAFTDLARTQVRRGAQLLVISTDDAWFGTSAGPYQHAQIAQLRAIETGTWVVRAAATGISGIIAPTGAYVERSRLDTQAVVTGMVGPPVGSVFEHIGATRIMLALAVLYLLILGSGAWMKRRGVHA